MRTHDAIVDIIVYGAFAVPIIVGTIYLIASRISEKRSEQKWAEFFAQPKF